MTTPDKLSEFSSPSSSSAAEQGTNAAPSTTEVETNFSADAANV